MRNPLLALGLIASAVACGQALALGEDDPLLTSAAVDQLEYRKNGAEDTVVLKADAWVGRDLHKWWFKVEGEQEDADDRKLELQALYSKAVSSYWDLQFGLRHDFEPTPSRNWAVIRLQGLTPYFLEVGAALFVGESGRTALRLEAEYELYLTHRLFLSPEVELNIFGQHDEELHVGSGLANAEAGLRLCYEIRREFAPYMGISWSKSFGDTADLVEQSGDDNSYTQWVIGIQAWF